MTPFNIGKIDDDASVETAWAEERLIENIGTVGGSDQDDPFAGVKAIHFDEKLVQGLFALIVSAADAGAAMAADSVDLVHENDAGGALFRLVEHVADAARADADKHLDEIRAGNREERAIGFSGDSFRDQGFTCSWSADAEDPFRDAGAEGGEFCWIFQEVDDLLKLFFGFIATGNIFEGHFIFVFGHQSGRRFAEVHSARADPFHLTREDKIEEEDDEKTGRSVRR